MKEKIKTSPTGGTTAERTNHKSDDDVAPETNMSWAGKKTKVNTLTGRGTFDPRVPIDQPGEEGDDALIWADVPEKLKDRLKDKPQIVTISTGNNFAYVSHTNFAHVIRMQLAYAKILDANYIRVRMRTRVSRM